jgi:hypothetical protein
VCNFQDAGLIIGGLEFKDYGFGFKIVHWVLEVLGFQSSSLHSRDQVVGLRFEVQVLIVEVSGYFCREKLMMESGSIVFGKIVDLLNRIGSPIRFLPNLSFVFVVYSIRVQLRRASLGIRIELGHRLIIVLEMAWGRQ